jgi:hypothetical protein
VVGRGESRSITRSVVPTGDKRMTNPRLRKSVLDVVRNQIRANDPPETKMTLDLLAAGHSRREAMDVIARVVVQEIWEIMKRNEPFDQGRFVKALKTLR